MSELKEIFLDVETGGLDPARSALLQVAGIICIDHNIKEEFEMKIKPFPDDRIDEKALAVNGFTMDMIKGKEFLEPPMAYHSLTSILKKYINKFDKSDKFHFAGYNSNTFDSQFIRNFFRKNGDIYYGSYFHHPTIDVMIIAADVLKSDRGGMENFRLNTVCQHCGLEWNEEEAHDALYDIRKTLELYQKLTAMRKN